MSLLYHAYVYLEFLILACTIYILAPLNRQVRVEGPEGRSTESHYDGEGLRAGLTTGKGESYTFLYHQGELMGEEGKEASGGGT